MRRACLLALLCGCSLAVLGGSALAQQPATGVAPAAPPPAASPPSLAAPDTGATTTTAPPAGEVTAADVLQGERVAEPAPASVARAVGQAPGLAGASGPLRLRAALSRPVGQFALGLWGQFLTMDDLIVEGDSDTRTRGALVGFFTPLDFLEISAAMRWASNDSTMTSPNLIQSQGDLLLGAKAFAPFAGAPGLSGGGVLALDASTAEGDVFWDPSATSVRLGGLLTWEAWAANPRVPLRLHANLGYSFENSLNVADRKLRAVENFAHDALAFDTVDLGVGLEAVLGAFVPFLEWGLRVPVATRRDTDEVCIPQERCPGNEGFGSYPHWLTLGLRADPLPGLRLSAAVDLGLTRTVVTGIPAIPPYNLVFGLSYAFDPTPEVEVRTVEKVVTKEVTRVEPQGTVRGRVVDRLTRQPIPGARLEYPGVTPPRTAQATGADGSFESYPFPVGSKVRIEVSAAPAYQPKAFQVEMKDGGVEFTFSLEPSDEELEVQGRVHDLDDMPVPGAQVQVVGVGEPLTADPVSGAFLLKLKPGSYQVRATANNYLSRERDLVIKPGEKAELDFQLRPKEKVVVVFKQNKLELKRPIHFAFGRADIQPDSFFILDQVMDLVVSHNVKKLRIEGHTDSDGNDAANLRLSQDRADAVKKYLVGQGMDGERLEAKGFGESRPVAPNRTPAGKALNRRVEFHVVDEAAVPPAGPAGAAPVAPRVP